MCQKLSNVVGITDGMVGSFKFVRVVGKPFHFWFDGQLSQDFSLVEVEEEGRDITIDWVETVVEDE